MGGNTPDRCITTSVAVVTAKMATRPASTAPVRRSPWRGAFPCEAEGDG